VDDGTFDDHLKLFAALTRLSGYWGSWWGLDEVASLHNLPNSQARRSNYDQILRIVNDCLQGSAPGLGFMFGATPESVTDTRRGLFSHPALESRLQENRFARDGLVDTSGPILRLANLSREDFYILLTNVRRVYASGAAGVSLPDEALEAFMDHCERRVGEAYFRTPRSAIKEFIGLLAVLEQNPGTRWEGQLQAVDVEGEDDPRLRSPATGGEEGGPAPLADRAAASTSVSEEDELATFRL
jgi:P-loop Domain of unknown function (DUF2791)